MHSSKLNLLERSFNKKTKIPSTHYLVSSSRNKLIFPKLVISNSSIIDQPFKPIQKHIIVTSINEIIHIEMNNESLSYTSGFYVRVRHMRASLKTIFAEITINSFKVSLRCLFQTIKLLSQPIHFVFLAGNLITSQLLLIHFF